MFDAIKRHVKKARAVLDRNWTGEYTMPAPGLYPHQWNWDSGFVAIGYSRYNTERAIVELTRLFGAQWKNGMLPQIVFNEERLGQYFPEPDFWRVEVSKNAPKGDGRALTSGITMPPVHALAVLKVYEHAKNPEDVLGFLKWIYPRLMASHRYLYRERDPGSTGLVYIRHPWESGMDNSPMWDLVLKRIDLDSSGIPEYRRRDLKDGIDPGSRPRDLDYDRFVYLVDLFRRLEYDEERIREASPFLIYGPLFNSILCVSNEALVKIAGIIGEDAREAEEWFNATSGAISQKLFNEERGTFDFFDLVEGRSLDVATAAGFMPLFAGAATIVQAQAVYGYLNSRSFCALHQGNCFSVPNYDTEREGYSRVNYWRGPVWININWMLMHGLRRYGFVQKAASIAKDILELPTRFGFYEYYDPLDGRGYGSKDFSWTAALFIDTAYDTYSRSGEVPILARVKRRLRRDIVINAIKGEAALAAPTRSDGLAQEMLSTIRDLKARYYTEEGRVDYARLAKSVEYAEYKSLAARLRGFDPGSLVQDAARRAFWINLYNTLVVDGIIALDIKSSVKEVMGLFHRVKYRVGEYEFSPDDIEHGILRANSRPYMHAFRQFGPFDARRRLALERTDPRIHFALVCGARSCAPIKFYTPEKIDTELDTAAVNFINSSEVVVMPEEGRVVLSMILKWYERDFGGGAGVLDFIERHLVDGDKKRFIRDEKPRIKTEYLPYDWNLNA